MASKILNSHTVRCISLYGDLDSRASEARNYGVSLCLSEMTVAIKTFLVDRFVCGHSLLSTATMREFEPDELPSGMATRALERVEEEEYDVYLFWPSAQTLDRPERDSHTPTSTPFSSEPHTEPPPNATIPPSLESLNLDGLENFQDLRSLPVTPVLASGASDFRFPECTPPGNAENIDESGQKATCSSYSNIMELGLFFSQFTHRAAVSFFRRVVKKER